MHSTQCICHYLWGGQVDRTVSVPFLYYGIYLRGIVYVHSVFAITFRVNKYALYSVNQAKRLTKKTSFITDSSQHSSIKHTNCANKCIKCDIKQN